MCNHVPVSHENKLYFKRVHEMVMQLTQLYETNWQDQLSQRTFNY